MANSSAASMIWIFATDSKYASSSSAPPAPACWPAAARTTGVAPREECAAVDLMLVCSRSAAAFVAVVAVSAALPLRAGEGRTDALAPSLRWPGPDGADGIPPASRAAAAAASTDAVELFVDCEHGSDAASGSSASQPLRTLTFAQKVARQHRGSPAGVIVTVLPGVCELEAPLLLTDDDSGVSETARIVWRGLGATISGGTAPSSSWPPSAASGASAAAGAAAAGEWEPVAWPGAPPSATVWSLDVTTWPIEIKTMRTVGGDWVPRSPWPKPAADFVRPSLAPTNYSANWLSIDPNLSSNGNDTVLPAVAQLGVRPHCSRGVCISDILRRPPASSPLHAHDVDAHPAAISSAAGTVTGDAVSDADADADSDGAAPSCASAPLLSHTAFKGAAIKVQTVATGAAGLAACRAACCANPGCLGWSVAGVDCDPVSAQTTAL